MPLLLTALMMGGTLAYGLSRDKEKSHTPDLPGPTDDEVLASDARMRRQLASQSGRRSTVVTGGLGGQRANVSMPSLVGVA